MVSVDKAKLETSVARAWRALQQLERDADAALEESIRLDASEMSAHLYSIQLDLLAKGKRRRRNQLRIYGSES
jgi:hypothetical protein